MSYFDISIDNDITYLLNEIGHNVKINNIPAKAIINNSSMERTFDDKRIITHEELYRGDYVNYNDLFFIVLNEVNDKRYNSYYKGLIRKCNFDIKFIMGDKLYLFPSIIEGEKFLIQENNVMNISADTISVTLPSTKITKKLKKQDSFIKWEQKWEVEGINHTEDGLIRLNCKAIILDKTIDDIENEIANRYKDGKDRLNGKIEPILPFDDVEPEPTEPENLVNYSIQLDGYDSIVYGQFEYYTANVYKDNIKVDKDVRFEIIADNPSWAWIVEDDRLEPNQCRVQATKEKEKRTFILKAYLVEDETVFDEMEIRLVAW